MCISLFYDQTIRAYVWQDTSFQDSKVVRHCVSVTSAQGKAPPQSNALW